MQFLNLTGVAIAAFVFSSCAMAQEVSNEKEIAPEQGKPEKISFDSIYADDKKLCVRLEDILENELDDFKSITIGKHKNFVAWTYMRLPEGSPNPEGVNDPNSLYGRILSKRRPNQHPYWALADINNNDDPEYIVRLESIKGVTFFIENDTRDHYSNREFVTIYSGGYPKLSEGSIHPKSTHFMYHGDTTVFNWVDIINFQYFPIYMDQLRPKEIIIGESSIFYADKLKTLIEKYGIIEEPLGAKVALSRRVTTHIFNYNDYNYFLTLDGEGEPRVATLTQYEDKTNIRLKCTLHNPKFKFGRG